MSRMDNWPVLAFDPSYTSSGYAFVKQCDCGDENMHTGTVRTAAGMHNLERQRFILEKVRMLLDKSQAKMLCIEGYAFARNDRAHMLGELCGLIKYEVNVRIGLPLLIVPPMSLKVFGTGSGKANKKQMMGHILTDWAYSIRQEDEADAFVLLKLAEAFCDRYKRRTYEEKRRKSIEKAEYVSPITVPDLDI